MKAEYQHPELDEITLSSDPYICETSPVNSDLEATTEDDFDF